MNIGLVVRTVAHLRLEQVVFQLLRRAHKPRLKAMRLSDGDGGRRMAVNPAPRWRCCDGETFEFLNVGDDFRGWNNTSHGMLWAYNQNYMDWLNQPGMTAAEGAGWIDRFIAGMAGNRVGLDPYPVALRGINWVKFFSRHPEAATRERLDALYSQYRLLERSLERHLLGNHLLEDAYSLYIGASCLGDRRMLGRAERLLRRQLREQTLADGAHYEQSPMYHCILLDRLLDCINIGGGDYVARELKPVAERMLGHLQTIVYADGTIPLLNDSAEGIAPTPAEIFAYASRLGLRWHAVALGACGYRKMADSHSESIVDVGNITATYQPGHTHADTFSFELRLGGRPFIVDTGISTYDKTPRRQLERSTAAHNTVTVGRRSSSEVWGGFRVGHRARVGLLRDEPMAVEAEHDGFGKQRKHRRRFELRDGEFVITDHILTPVEAQAYLHFAPGVEVTGYDDTMIHTSLGDVAIDGATHVEITDGTVSHSYNRFEPVKVAVVDFSQNLQTRISL